MQASEIITQARRELVETVGSFWSDDELLDLINRAERDFTNKTRMLEGTANLDLVSGQAAYPLPSDWLSARALFINFPNDAGEANWRRVQPSNLEKQAQEKHNLLSSDENSLGEPRRYWIWARELYFDPIPDEVYNVQLFYKSKPIPLNESEDSLNIDDSLSDGILAYVLWKAWSKEKEFQLAAQAKADYQEYVLQGRRWVKKQSADQRYRIDMESPNRFSGTSTQGWDPLA